ncbi:MAG: FlgO family outer membrane protein [Syntrophales bacterium]
MKRLAFLVFAATVFLGCTQSVQPIKTDPASLQYVKGTVLSVSGNEIILSLKLPEFRKAADTPAAEIAQQIVQKGLFIEGLNIAINGNGGEIKKVIGNSITILLNKPPAYSVGQNVKLEIPKKKIAIVDFTVIRGGLKEAGAILMEQLSTLLIESKHYIVVERSKLNTIMEEMKLLQSGLTETIPEQMRPRLMFADLILTGTLAEMGDKYDINLRLLNVRTGQAIAAINVSSPLFKPVEMRDASDWNEDFEATLIDRSWAVGPRGKGEGFVKVDGKTGVDNSKKSLRMDYTFDLSKKERLCPGIRNNKKRDLSLFRGIEFYVKGTHSITGYLNIDISDRDDHAVRNRWFTRYEITDDWQLVKIPFDQLSYTRSEGLIKIEGFKPGRQVLDMTHVETLIFGTCNDMVSEEAKKGSMWIDNIRFYK